MASRQRRRRCLGRECNYYEDVSVDGLHVREVCTYFKPPSKSFQYSSEPRVSWTVSPVARVSSGAARLEARRAGRRRRRQESIV